MRPQLTETRQYKAEAYISQKFETVIIHIATSSPNRKYNNNKYLHRTHRGDSNENIQHTNINIKTKIILNYPKYNTVCSYGVSSLGLKNEFETAMVNEPSMFEPLKFYCISFREEKLCKCNTSDTESYGKRNAYM